MVCEGGNVVWSYRINGYFICVLYWCRCRCQLLREMNSKKEEDFFVRRIKYIIWFVPIMIGIGIYIQLEGGDGFPPLIAAGAILLTWGILKILETRNKTRNKKRSV